MRILVHEFVSGGGLAGRAVTPSLAREGGAMLAALVADLAALGQHQVVTTTDSRFSVSVPSGVRVVTLEPGRNHGQLEDLIAAADATWVIAPESDGTLEQLTARVERTGRVLGSSAAAIRRAADKASLPRRLSRHGIAHPKTSVLPPDDDGEPAASRIGYPLIVKPARGAGCYGVCRVRDARGLRQAIHVSRRLCGPVPLLLQQFVPGVPASVSLLADGRRAIALTVNRQTLGGRFGLAYRGGVTPIDHPQVDRAVDAAVRVCRALPGLRGYIGVDVVLTQSDAVVIEVNPRLTTAYLGARAAFDDNIAELAFRACVDCAGPVPRVRRRVRFDAAGRVSAIREPPGCIPG